MTKISEAVKTCLFGKSGQDKGSFVNLAVIVTQAPVVSLLWSYGPDRVFKYCVLQLARTCNAVLQQVTLCPAT